MQIKKDFSFLKSIAFWFTINPICYLKFIGISLSLMAGCCAFFYSTTFLNFVLNNYVNYLIAILIVVLHIMNFAYAFCLIVNMLTYLAKYKRLSFRESLISPICVLRSILINFLTSLMISITLPIFPLSFYLAVRYWFAFRICLDTDKSVSDCFDMSSRCTRGARWKLFFVIIVCCLLPFLYPFVMARVYAVLKSQVDEDTKKYEQSLSD